MRESRTWQDLRATAPDTSSPGSTFVLLGAGGNGGAGSFGGGSVAADFSVGEGDFRTNSPVAGCASRQAGVVALASGLWE
jgi:hypothetical protein